MKIKELIGKRIWDIKDKVKISDSNKELQTSTGIVKLENGKVFEIPYRNSEHLVLIEEESLGYKSIFNKDGFFKGLFSKMIYDKKIANQNRNEMEGKVITGIYQFNEAKDEDEWNELEERMIIELESGYMISEVGMSPRGTNAAGLYIFSTKEELEKRYHQRLVKIY